MERYSDEAIRIIDELHTERLDYQSEYIPLIDAAQRLDAYESTGMEPENIGALQEELNQYKELGDLHRLRELVQADREGRCVVLPCKFGNKVYFPLLGRIIEKTVYSIVTFSNSQRIYCDGTSEFFRPENFGKTVFLTRAAAEKALEEMEENRNGRVYRETRSAGRGEKTSH